MYNLTFDAATEMSVIETKVLSSTICGGAFVKGIPHEDFLRVAKVTRASEVASFLLNENLGPEVAANIFGFPRTPAAIIPQCFGLLGTMFQCVLALWSLGAGAADSTRFFIAVRRLEDLNRGIAFSPFEGPSPCLDHLAAITNLHSSGDAPELMFLFMSSMMQSSALMQRRRTAGGSPARMDPASIPATVAKWGTKLDLGFDPGDAQKAVLDSVRELMNGSHQGKRQRTSPGAQVSTPIAAGSAGGQAAAGSLSPGKVIRHCFDFNRPQGCSRPMCNRDHVLVQCIHHPGCTLDPNLCKYHHP